MSITDLLTQTEGANITVSIGLKDLRTWHEEVIASTRELKEPIKEKAEEEYLSPAEVCERLSVSRSSLTRWQNAGYLVPSKVGGQCRYKRSEIEAILNTKMK